jgi:DNA-binding NarL/FixJ family response regulator
MDTNLISVLLADEHTMYREALARTLGKSPSLRIIGQCGNGPEAEKLYSALQPDITLIDVTVYSARGFTTARHILDKHPEAKVIGLTTFFIAAYASRILSSGAKGYVTKSMSYIHLLDAVRKVYEGETYLCNEFQQQD